MQTYAALIAKLKSMKNEKNIAGMARFGISPKGTLGIPVPVLRSMAKKLGKNHPLAIQLWNTKIHEARLLAAFIDEPAKVTYKQLEKWAKETDSWDTCDLACSNLFDRTEFAWKIVVSWTNRKEEFVKRYAFTMMAVLAVHDKKAKDKEFVRLLPLIAKASTDERNFVKKAVNWALRQIGKRNRKLNGKAIACAKKILHTYPYSKAARWVANGAVRELERPEVRVRWKPN